MTAAKQKRRLEALIALSKDPGATEAERQLAAARAAEIQGTSKPRKGQGPVDYVVIDEEFEISDDLIAAMDRSMARAASVRNSTYRGARIRAAEHRLGRTVAKQWRDGRGPALRR